MKRKRFLFCLILTAFFIPGMLFAQLAIKLELNRKNYLQYENIYATVIVRNLSANSLVFGKHQKLKGQLKFDIETASGKRVHLRKEKPTLLGKVIAPGKTESVVVSLPQLYNITAPGKYKVKAVVSHSRLGSAYQSEWVDFKVTSGTTVWERVVGVPTTGKSPKGQKIPKRQYKLLSFYDGMNHVYCLMVEDNKFIYGVARIGYDIGSMKPKCEIDKFSKVHILIQSSPKIFSYYVYDTDCHLETKAVYRKKGEIDPCLKRNPDTGNVVVAGGEKAKEGKDYVVAKER